MPSTAAASTQILPEGERRASWRPPRPVAIAGLGIVAVLQALAFAYIRGDTDGPTPFLKRGDDLSNLSLRDSHGVLQELGAGHPTLLLVFDPNCVHSRSVAPLWTNWLERSAPKRYRIIAVATGPVAADYMRGRQWPVIVASAEPVGHVITKRTPWVFAVDGQGRVLADGHGRHLPEIARDLRSAERRIARYSPQSLGQSLGHSKPWRDPLSKIPGPRGIGLVLR